MNKFVREALAEIFQRLTTIDERLTTMANDLDTILDSIDTETTAIAAQIQKLVADVTAANANALTPAQKSRAADLVQRLTTLASDPTNPVPNPLPAATPTP